jgi:uncharacterized membrane protein
MRDDQLMLLDHQPAVRERPLGVTLIAAAHVLVAIVALVIAVGTFLGRIPLASGAFLVGGELETAGPILFLLITIVFLIAAAGLWKLKNWSRHLAIGFALIGLIQVTPAISSAVADGRIFAIIREGTQIIIRVIIIWYLLQEPVRDQFN